MIALATLADVIIVAGAVALAFAAFGAACDLTDDVIDRLRGER